MKALSVRQPWAHAILALGKRVENWDWSGCSYRGPVLLHASKTLVLKEFREDIESVRSILTRAGEDRALVPAPRDIAVLTSKGWRPAPGLPLGGIVGRARIAGVVFGDAGIREIERLNPDATARAWYAGGFALVLADVEPLPFIPWKGSPGFFNVPDAVAAELCREQERRVRGEAPSAHCALAPGPCALRGPSRMCTCLCGPCERARTFEMTTRQIGAEAPC